MAIDAKSDRLKKIQVHFSGHLHRSPKLGASPITKQPNKPITCEPDVAFLSVMAAPPVGDISITLLETRGHDKIDAYVNTTIGAKAFKSAVVKGTKAAKVCAHRTYWAAGSGGSPTRRWVALVWVEVHRPVDLTGSLCANAIGLQFAGRTGS